MPAAASRIIARPKLGSVAKTLPLSSVLIGTRGSVGKPTANGLRRAKFRIAAFSRFIVIRFPKMLKKAYKISKKH
jgi:hypothetical protein